MVRGAGVGGGGGGDGEGEGARARSGVIDPTIPRTPETHSGMARTHAGPRKCSCCSDRSCRMSGGARGRPVGVGAYSSSAGCSCCSDHSSWQCAAADCSSRTADGTCSEFTSSRCILKHPATHARTHRETQSRRDKHAHACVCTPARAQAFKHARRHECAHHAGARSAWPGLHRDWGSPRPHLHRD